MIPRAPLSDEALLQGATISTGLSLGRVLTTDELNCNGNIHVQGDSAVNNFTTWGTLAAQGLVYLNSNVTISSVAVPQTLQAGMLTANYATLAGCCVGTRNILTDYSAITSSISGLQTSLGSVGSSLGGLAFTAADGYGPAIQVAHTNSAMIRLRPAPYTDNNCFGVDQTGIFLRSNTNSTVWVVNTNGRCWASGGFLSNVNGSTLNGLFVTGPALVSGAMSVGGVLTCGSDLNATGVVTAVGGVWSGSDVRYKTNIEELSLGLDFVRQLQPIAYRMPKSEKGYHFGLSAQQVKETIKNSPYADFSGIHEEEDGYLKLNYQNLFGPLINAIQELEARVCDLEKT